MKSLTARQREILQFLDAYIGENGFPPTIREIKDAFGLRSNRGVVDHLRALERKGCIKRNRRSSRAIEIINRIRVGIEGGIAEKRFISCPVAGRIHAGEPSFAVEDIIETVELDRALFPEHVDFLLEVRGDSMIEDHIAPGDLLAVKRTVECRNGDTVVAIVDGEATVKRWYRRGESVVLKPANRTYEPIRLEGEALRALGIAGKVVGVIRRFRRRKQPFSG